MQCYIDDIITGANDAEHLSNLQDVLQCLDEHGLKVKSEKCRFMQPFVHFLGHRTD